MVKPLREGSGTTAPASATRQPTSPQQGRSSLTVISSNSRITTSGDIQDHRTCRGLQDTCVSVHPTAAAYLRGEIKQHSYFQSNPLFYCLWLPHDLYTMYLLNARTGLHNCRTPVVAISSQEVYPRILQTQVPSSCFLGARCQ